MENKNKPQAAPDRSPLRNPGHVANKPSAPNANAGALGIGGMNYEEYQKKRKQEVEALRAGNPINKKIERKVEDKKVEDA